MFNKRMNLMAFSESGNLSSQNGTVVPPTHSVPCNKRSATLRDVQVTNVLQCGSPVRVDGMRHAAELAKSHVSNSENGRSLQHPWGNTHGVLSAAQGC